MVPMYLTLGVSNIYIVSLWALCRRREGGMPLEMKSLLVRAFCNIVTDTTPVDINKTSDSMGERGLHPYN